MARRLLIWLAYLLAVLAFFEASARLALRNQTFFERVAAGDSTTYRLVWLERHAGSGTQTNYAFDEWSPTLGWKLKPNLRDVDAFDGKLLNSNAHGLRGRRESDYEKPPGIFRIVVLGDSFTFGEGVGDEETYSHVLQELLPQIEVLNLGVHGYGHDQMLLYLEEEGLRYQPDLVLLGFLSIDMGRNILDFRDYAKPRFVLREGLLVLTHSPVPSVNETLEEARSVSLGREDRQIPAIYLRPYLLPKLKQGALLEAHGHWGPLEHRIVAEEIAAELVAQGLVPKAAAH